MNLDTTRKWQNAEEMRAIRMVRQAIREGYSVSLYPENDLSDPLHIRSRSADDIIEDLFACDEMTLILSKRVHSGNGKREVGATFSLVYQGADDPDGPIGDYTANSVGERFFKVAYGLPLD